VGWGVTKWLARLPVARRTIVLVPGSNIGRVGRGGGVSSLGKKQRCRSGPLYDGALSVWSDTSKFKKSKKYTRGKDFKQKSTYEKMKGGGKLKSTKDKENMHSRTSHMLEK